MALAAPLPCPRHRRDGGDPDLERELAEHGFKHLRIWSRGVDIEKFHPVPGHRLAYEGPIWIYVGRVAIEKNIESFLALDIPGTKVVVGDGPAKGALSQKYPAVKFLGNLTGEALTRGPMPAATSSSFPAAPTPSAW